MPVDGTIILDILFIYLILRPHVRKESLNLFQDTIKCIQILLMWKIILYANNISHVNLFSV